jgi:carbonic anhydrase
MRRQRHHRRSIAAVLFALLVAAAAPAQHDAHDAPPARPAAETKNGAPMRPTHAPQPELPPLLAWRHVRTGNEALVAARAARRPAPAPAERPAGAGRYVCAAIVCADADVDVPALLGLARRDVLLLSAPGPFVPPEAVALLEQAVADERLSLIVVLGHADCRTLATRRGVSPGQDAVADRLDAVRRDAERTQATLVQSLVRLQCQQLLAASDLLRQHARGDTLRVLPAELDARSGALTWHHARIDEFSLRPIR